MLKEIEALNRDSSIHGIIVQLPPESDNPVDPATVTNAVIPEKDVDGLVKIDHAFTWHFTLM